MAVNVVGGPLEWDAVINNSQFKRQIDEMHAKISGFNNDVQKQASGIDSFVKKAALAVGGYMSLVGGANLVGTIVQVRGEIQALETSFRVMLQSKEKADQLMMEVTQFAATTPFGLQEVAGATKQLLAFGFSADEVKSTLRSLGDVASGLGQPLSEIAYLYGTIRTAGVANAVDLKQFAQRGIPIYTELSKVLKVGTDEIGAMVSAGKIGFPEIEKVFQSMTAAGSLFGGQMEEQSKTILGLQSNLKDAIDQMFNDIGKGQDGIITGTIKGAIAIVENYQTIIDVLKVAAVTFGTYKAATIAATVAQNIHTASLNGWTVAELLRFKAMQISQRAMALLNATMLTNPWVAGTAAIMGLVAAFVMFHKEATNVKSATDLIAEVQEKSTHTYSDQEAKIKSLVVQLKSANVTEGERLKIYKQLKDIDPKIVDGLDAKSIAYDKLASNVDKYLQALRKQIDLEANEDALTASIKQENAIKALIKQEDEIAAARNRNRSSLQPAYAGQSEIESQNDAKRRSQLVKQLAEQEKVTASLGDTVTKAKTDQDSHTEAVARTVAVIDEEIKAEQEKQKNLSASSEQYKEYQKRINDLEAEREKITGKASTKDMAKQVREFKKDMEAFLKELETVEGEARRTGLTKEQSELDKINEQYDELLAKAKELGAGLGIEQRIENARKIQTGNFKIRQQVDEYIKGLDDQREAFERFEDAKREYGIENAKRMYEGQIQGFDSYLEYLDNEITKAFANRNTLDGKLKLEELGKQYTEAEKKQQRERAELEQKYFADALQGSKTFNSDRLELEKTYEQQRAALKKNYAGADLEDRLKVLDDQHEKELSQLTNYGQKYADVFKKLNEEVTFFTRKQLQEQKKELQKYLRENPGLPPGMVKEIQQVIKSLDELSKQTAGSAVIAEDFAKIADGAGQIGGAISQAANAVRDLNPELADTLDNISAIIGAALMAANAIASFASGNILGGITGSVGALMSVIASISKDRQERLRLEDEVKQFQQAIYDGEYEVNLLYRARAREQAKINEMRLDGLEKEKELLLGQADEITAQYKQVFSELQQESFIVGKRVVFDLNAIDYVEKIDFESLFGKTYEQIEELFIKGQLTEKAAGLFKVLQKLKEEGADVDRALTESNREYQELLTGTTAENITDSIIQGFAEGKRAAADFGENFQDVMRNAILQSLKYSALEGPLKQFYEQFALDAESGGGLTESEIAKLRERYDEIISNAGERFEELQKITDVAFQNTSGSNSLKGGIQSQLTEQTGSVLAGHFAGLRLDVRAQLEIATRSVNHLARIEVNTNNLSSIDARLKNLELHGIKIKA